MRIRQLGANGPSVSSIGFIFPDSFYNSEAPENEKLETALRYALDSGVSLLELSDSQFDQSLLTCVREVLSSRRRESMTISLTYGAIRNSSGSIIGLDIGAQSMTRAVERTLDSLDLNFIDVIQPARLNSEILLEESLRSILTLVRTGHVRHIGLPSVTGALLRTAYSVHPISWIKTEYSLASRDAESDLLPVARELGVSVAAYNVLKSGIFSRELLGNSRDETDKVPLWPPFRGNHNYDLSKLLKAVQQCAVEKNVSTAQIAIAWLLAQGSDLIPLICTSRQHRVKEAIDAIDVHLTVEDLNRLDSFRYQLSMAEA